MPFDKPIRAALPCVLAFVVSAGCAEPSPATQESASIPENSSVGSPTTEIATASPSESAPESTPTPSAEVTDPTRLIECRQVPEDVCFEYAIAMIRGPQPEYAAGIERVLVTCERLPPCGADRQDSGGKIMILYTNGWAWTQDWAVMSGA